MVSPVFVIMFSNEIGSDGKLLPAVLEQISSASSKEFANNPNGDSEPPTESFLSLLDEKNQRINELKKQVDNQKMQLAYYLNERIPFQTIEKISESCSSYVPDENMSVTLALTKFYKQFGLKTKLSMTYERISTVNEKVSSLLQEQDFILRKIINKLWEFVKQHTINEEMGGDTEFIDFVKDQGNIELFNKLLRATERFMGKMECFKICCQRLIAVEEERNGIVDQVYSMPLEERMNCNYLLSIKMQNLQLETEMRRILERQQIHKDRLKELNVIEGVLSNLQRELKQSYNKDTECYINKMLDKLNEDANALLEVTKKKRRKYESELKNTEGRHTVILNRILSFIRLAVENKNLSDNDLNGDNIITHEEFRLFEYVKIEVDKLRQNLIDEFEQETEKRIKEYDSLKKKLNQVMFKTNKVKKAANKYKKDLKELKFQNVSEIMKLREERDFYKVQVEDLQSIREAYAQLVERQPNTIKMEREFLTQMDERDKRIYELEEENDLMSAEISSMRKKMNEKLCELSLLNRFIRLKTPSERHFVHEVLVRNLSSKDQNYIDSGMENSHSSIIYSDSSQNRPEILKLFPELTSSQEVSSAIPVPDTSFTQSYDEKVLRKKRAFVIPANKPHRKTLESSAAPIKIIAGRSMDKIISKSSSDFSLPGPSGLRPLSRDNFGKIANATANEGQKRKNLSEAAIKGRFDSVNGDDSNLDENELLRDCSKETVAVACHSKKSLLSANKDMILIFGEKK